MAHAGPPSLPWHSEEKEQTKPWWQLVWCHERFQRDGRIETLRREAFQHATAVAGAQLRCMRRIKQLENCSGGLGDMPYVLLTAWREVKSCLEILARQDPQNHPVFTMILCEVKGQSRRVCRWAESWPAHATFPVYVCQHLSCPTTLVYDMLDKLILHKRNTVQRPPLPIGHCDGHSVQHVSGQAYVDSMQQNEERDGSQSGLPLSQPPEVDRLLET